jgi:hypothetical protein
LADENVWVGFLTEDVLFTPEPGSPKFHDHEEAAGLDRSVNVTDCPVTGDRGDQLKLAVGGPVMTAECITGVLEPDPLVAVSETA